MNKGNFVYNERMNGTLDVAIPAHNEEDVIVPTLRLVSDVLASVPELSWRIIVAENGSSDRTYKVVKDAALPKVEIFSSAKRGKGAALKEAATRSDADHFAFVDADCSAHPAALLGGLMLLEDRDIIIGSRFHPETEQDRDWIRNGSSRAFNLFARALLGIRVDDTQCPLKVMTRSAKELLLNCHEDTWFLDLELIARAERQGLRVETIPVMWTEFRYPQRKSKLARGRDGSKAIAAMLSMRERLKN